MVKFPPWRRQVAVLAAVLGLGANAQAALVDVTVTVHNLAPANSISFAPLHFGFNDGRFDAFDLGGVASAPIISVAEGGAGDVWQAAFAAADPTASRGTVGGLLLPGASRELTVRVDTRLNPFFTFAAMAVPSNDFFIGNDDPMQYRLFDAAGHLQIGAIGVKANAIWDAGSEVFDPAASAFVGTNDLRRPQNSVVAFNFAEFAGFNGQTTGAGDVFDSGLNAESDVYRIAFSAVAAPVPEPQTWALMLAALPCLAWVSARRRKSRR